ncbi:MAG: ABC transporter ATP-binding protein [Chitinophagaceae bacterium]|jgi:ABC-2 type transport system ATP-binding protein|nr:ABC transporter ATP-binding protein [Chitinophagaceae bacterium]MBK8299749.1 ABC transporter ATP-binding protein [Chitinophagaceae bacterium]MBK9463798.1 ABC transporter ATP-binding protein [Chitinophagaceae bacterium]MBK9659087.1 ABC transporter ATP-binding protein [Chitinophagaceae bacterium]MBK9937392.1 ABC transporter ATP-binding protein [Chitinophagaceae bacterium]
MSVVLSIKNLAKSYGAVRALNGVSFDVPQGSVFGILGPNGSGKTTLLGIVMDVLRANKGEFYWFGQPGGSPEQRKKIGSLLETPNFYSYLSGTDNLKISQAISGRGTRKDIDEILKKVNLYDRRWSSFKSFSLGMKQRLAIGAALLGDPKVLVLDEPTNGLDPVGIAEIRNLIVELKDKGHTIIMASHLLDEVEKVCTHAAILKTGNIITTGTVEDIMKDEDVVELSAADINVLLKVLQNMGKEVLLDEKANTVQIIFPKGMAKMEEINRHCFDNGVVLTQLVLRKKRLEARFFELTSN